MEAKHIFAPDECECHGGDSKLHLRHGWLDDSLPEPPPLAGKTPIALGEK